LARLSNDEFDLRRAAVVAEPLDIPLGGTTGSSMAQVTAYAPNRISVEVDADGDGLLILSEIYYPGWRASLDDTPVRLIRADGLLRGISVPAGQHTVRVWYAPLTARIGLGISALTLVIVIGVGGWYVMRKT